MAKYAGQRQTVDAPAGWLARHYLWAALRNEMADEKARALRHYRMAAEMAEREGDLKTLAAAAERTKYMRRQARSR